MARAQLCPFCFREFDLDEVQWRCLHPACTSPESGRPLEVDQAYTDFLAEATGTPRGPQQLKHSFGPIPRRKRLGGLLHTKDVRVAYCDWCNNVTERRLCPSCHNELPYTIDSMSMHIVAIVGAAAVGKSHYIAVLVNQLANTLGLSFNLAIDALNDETTLRYRTEFADPLFKQKRTIVKSQQLDQKPLMYRLHLKTSTGSGRSVTLVFFDTAGENFATEAELGLFARYVRHASAIILLVDPLQMGPIREQLSNSRIPLPEEHVEPADIVARLIHQYEAFGITKTGKKTTVPVAVAFTKSDALKEGGILKPGNAVYSGARHSGAFDSTTALAIHDEVRSLMARWQGAELDTLLDHYFARYQYFALSALGDAPALDGTLTRIAPFRVEDPFLWSLGEIGFLERS